MVPNVMPYKMTYNSEAKALYMYVRDGEVQRTEERGPDILVDFDTQEVIGIEVLDIDADLAPIIREFGLHPHLLDVLNKLRQLIPEAKKELVLA